MSRLLNKIKLFDVSLRDGLQGLSAVEQRNLKFYHKKNIYNEIVREYKPDSVEVGSFVSPIVLPVFSDTKELLEYANKSNPSIPHYVVVPNNDYLIKALASGSTSFSFLTSASNSFQLKNTKMTLYDNMVNLNRMMTTLALTGNTYNTRIYLSCVNECPIEGKISNASVIGELFALSTLQPNKVCISDTCGTLSCDDFVEIIEGIKKVGINTSILSLHLHIKPKRTIEVERIVHKALDYGIDEFDVSVLETGGCSVTMEQKKLTPNLSYKLMADFISNYERNKIDEI